jgi:hypothetical protein
VRQDYTQNLDYGHLGLQHRNILLKVLSQANPHHLISIGNVVLFNKNAESKLQEGRWYQISCGLENETLTHPVAPRLWYKPWARAFN